MTTEEKAKAYDEMTRLLSNWYKSETDIGIKDHISAIYPELAESEDERIRKWLINLVKNHIRWLEDRVKEQLSNGQIYGEELSKAQVSLAWLERQGEQKPTDKIEPQPKQEWSVEDRSKIQRICIYLNEAKKYYADITEVRECIDWLKSLRPQNQGEPSEQNLPSVNEHIWLYIVDDVLTWKDGIGQYLDDARVQELAKKLCNKYAQIITPIQTT